MSSVNHHPSTDLLLDYHHGRLPQGQMITMQAHMDLCPRCRTQLQLFDAVGGALLDEVRGIDLSPDALDLALARIERPYEVVIADGVAAKPVKPIKPRPYLDGITLPAGLDASDFKPRYWAAPGVWIASLADEDDGAHTYLMGVRPGMVMPDHDHRGLEMTLVIAGRFSDVNGDYEVGDFTACAPGDIHAPAISMGRECICLISAVAPIAPKSWLGKVLQPFARI